MKLIDLSREIHHKMARLPNHPMVIIAPFSTHEEKRVADGYTFSSAVTSLTSTCAKRAGLELSMAPDFADFSP